MKKRRNGLVMGLTVLLAAVAFWTFIPLALAVPTATNIGVADAHGYTGAHVLVPVNITTVQDGPVPSLIFDIKYDNNVINVSEVQKGALTENFTVAVGSYNTTTSDFSSVGTQKFIGDGSAKAFLDIPAAEFTVPKGNNLSLQVSNPSTDLVIKTGAGNSFITSPETDPDYPVPELSTTILFSVGLLALAAYILRPCFLKR